MQSMTFTSSQSMWVFLRNSALPGDPKRTFREAGRCCRELELPQACVRENVSVSEKTHIPPAPHVLQLVVGARAGG